MGLTRCFKAKVYNVTLHNNVVIVVRYGYYCPCTFEFCTVTAARNWLDPVLAIQFTLLKCVR